MKTAFVFLILCLLSVFSFASSTKKNVARLSSGKIIRVYRWNYDSSQFALRLTFNPKDYWYCRHKSKRTGTEQSYVRFATEDSTRPYYSMVLQQLDSLAHAHHFNKSEFAGFLIAFVQQAIYYKKDPYNWGNDYPRYGIETLVDHHGDCEDMACLLIGLLRSVNYDVVLIAIPGHMALGISCADCGGRCFELNGRSYFYLESTGPGNPLGYEPKEMVNRQHSLYNVPQTAFFDRSSNSIINASYLNTDSTCQTQDCYTTECNKTNTAVKSSKPAPKYNYSNHTLNNITQTKGQPKNIIQLSEVRVKGAY
jgi:hypothetical protein